MNTLRIHRRQHIAGDRAGVRCAFTQIDLILTVLILSILAAIAAPKFGASMESARLDAAAQQVRADLEYVRRYARTTGTTHRLQFASGGDSYSSPTVPRPHAPGEFLQVDLSNAGYGGFLVTSTFGDPVSNEVTFDMHGRPDAGGEVRISRGPRVRTVSVNAVSGRIEVQP